MSLDTLDAAAKGFGEAPAGRGAIVANAACIGD
jgi:hypothetical protein